MAKTNYNQEKRKKEFARKARQDARLARRQARKEGDAAPANDADANDAGATVAPLEPKP
jgi:hypothetical protein